MSQLLPWQLDRTHWYFDGGQLVEVASLACVPEEVEDYASISDAKNFLESCGFQGRSAHVISSEYHALCLAVIEVAVERHGQVLTVYRGQQGGIRSLPLEDHRVLYGSADPAVAEWYGPVESFVVKGLITWARASVLAPGDLGASDQEVVFFPQTILS